MADKFGTPDTPIPGNAEPLVSGAISDKHEPMHTLKEMQGDPPPAGRHAGQSVGPENTKPRPSKR